MAKSAKGPGRQFAQAEAGEDETRASLPPADPAQAAIAEAVLAVADELAQLRQLLAERLRLRCRADVSGLEHHD